MTDIRRKRLSWEQTAINLAHNIADYRSEDPYVQVGAVVVKNDNSLLVGYNGAPSGIEINWADRDARRDRVLHAEANVLNYVMPGEAKILACTHLPCKECIKIIAQKKISMVYFSDVLKNYDSKLTFDLAREFGIILNKVHAHV